MPTSPSPIDRLRQLHRSDASVTGWTSEEFEQAALRGKAMHAATQATFDIEYPMFGDATAAVDATFELPVNDFEVARHAGESRRLCQVAEYFLRWALCPRTRHAPNPYEPWVEIWEHGGRLVPEHVFVDVFDAVGVRACSLQTRPLRTPGGERTRLEAVATADANLTPLRCPFCGQPCPSYRRTCKHCSRVVQ